MNALPRLSLNPNGLAEPLRLARPPTDINRSPAAPSPQSGINLRLSWPVLGLGAAIAITGYLWWDQRAENLKTRAEMAQLSTQLTTLKSEYGSDAMAAAVRATAVVAAKVADIETTTAAKFVEADKQRGDLKDQVGAVKKVTDDICFFTKPTGAKGITGKGVGPC